MALYDGTNAPIIKVYLDTGNRTSGFFTLSWSLLGGADVLGDYTPFTVLTQMPATDVKKINIRRGRTREDQSIQPGTMTLTMDNTSGSYDPEFVKSATVTAASGNGTTVTYTATNSFNVGEIISVHGLSVAGLNLNLQTIVSASATQFTVSNSASGSCSGQAGSAKTGYIYFDSVSVNSLLVAGTGVRVTATIDYSGTLRERNLFTGFIEQIDKDMSLEPVTIISCVDGMAQLSKMVTNLNTNMMDTAEAVRNILTSAGWNYFVQGSSYDAMTVSKIPVGDAIAMIDSITTTQPASMFFCDTQGRATYYNYDEFKPGTFSGHVKFFTLTDSRASTDVIEYDSISVIGGEKYRRNKVTINNIDQYGLESSVTKFNQASVARYGPFPAEVATYYYDGNRNTIAQRLANQFADSEYRVDNIGFECVGFSSFLWDLILLADLGSAVLVSRTPIYTNNTALNYQCYIQEIIHTISPDSWRMSLSLSPGT